MDYKNGDVVNIEAIKVDGHCIGGRLYVKIVKKKDGLYFKPLLLKYYTAIPVSVIDYYSPISVPYGERNNQLELENPITPVGLLYCKVLWAIISKAWKETKPIVNSVKTN
jgi:hypothetical protein